MIQYPFKVITNSQLNLIPYIMELGKEKIFVILHY